MPASSEDYLNPKQELFCKFYAEGETQLRAYELAGYTPSSSNANNLAKRPAIKRRVAEIKQEIMQRELEFEALRRQAGDSPEAQIEAADWTFQRIMDMMAENVRCAQIAGEYKAANECLKMMADSMGMLNKAKSDADNGKQAGAQNTLALIGKVTQVFTDEGGGSDGAGDNPLAPRLRGA